MERMARPKSEDRRDAIMSAASRVIASQGLGAATATIAKEAGISNGSLFTYVETKADLLNQLYLELKTEMAAAALDGLPAGADLRKQTLHAWTNWTAWAVANPEKRRALAQLGVSDEITPASRAAGHKTMAGIADLMGQIHASGSMRKAPKAFVAEIMNSLVEATMDYMVRDPTNAKKHSQTGFDALWRVIA
jgi:AcrR family transcriptional regulator